MQHLSGLSKKDIQKIIVDDLGWPKYRAAQVHDWVYGHWSNDMEAWTNLSATQREDLAAKCKISPLELVDRQVSKKDPTQKFLFAIESGSMIESVLMRFKGRENLSACISSQVGCAVGCPFCATGKLGFKQNLHYSEIVDQVMTMQRVTGEKIDNLVYMGQGEPLNNYENVVESINVFRKSVGIGVRSITVSTSGVVPKIIELGKTGLGINLAISLHSAKQDIREYLVPVAKRWDLHELMESLKEYYGYTKRRITFEYILLKDLTDTAEDAWALCDLLSEIPYPCLINLIPYNSTGDEFERPDKERVEAFKAIVSRMRHKVTVRVTMGDDIDAACGQLHNKKLKKLA